MDIDSMLSELLSDAETVTPESSATNTPARKFPFACPVRGGYKVVGTFLPNQYVNERHKAGHFGVDLASGAGTPIYPIGPGIVVSTADNPKGGHTCKLSHSDGKVTSYYAHMASVAVKVGQEVGADDILGAMGSSGNANGVNHLHLETKVNGSYVDPFSLFGKTASTKIDSIQKFAARSMAETIIDQYVGIAGVGRKILNKTQDLTLAGSLARRLAQRIATMK